MKLLGEYSNFDEISYGEDAYSYANSRFSLTSGALLRGTLGASDIDYYQLNVGVNALYKLTISTNSTNDRSSRMIRILLRRVEYLRRISRVGPPWFTLRDHRIAAPLPPSLA